MRKLSTVSIFKGRNLAASVGKIAKLAIINLLSEAFFPSQKRGVLVPNCKTVKTLLVTLPADTITFPLKFTINYITTFSICQYKFFIDRKIWCFCEVPSAISVLCSENNQQFLIPKTVANSPAKSSERSKIENRRALPSKKS